LREAGLTERESARPRSPIGLDLGARKLEETALSIAAEVVAARRGGTGVPLTGCKTPIHSPGGEGHGGGGSLTARSHGVDRVVTFRARAYGRTMETSVDGTVH
jgi:xanthine dehydrogenase accessory factor